MRFDVFTLFPEWFEWFKKQRHVTNLLSADNELNLINYRPYTPLRAGQVDDTPYGGGAGMVLRVDVVDQALASYYGVDPVKRRQEKRVIALAPVGRQLNDSLVRELAQEDHLTLLCARYEGFDERILTQFASDVISVGPYVLSGGELAAMVVCDAVMRKLPGALGDETSLDEESFSEALGGGLEYPHFTRPASYRGWSVPDVLRSGNHAQVRRWRLQRSKLRTDQSSSDSVDDGAENP